MKFMNQGSKLEATPIVKMAARNPSQAHSRPAVSVKERTDKELDHLSLVDFCAQLDDYTPTVRVLSLKFTV